MQTIALWAIVWACIIVAICAAWSISREHDKVFLWKMEIADQLERQFNVSHKEGFRMADTAFQFTQVWYRTEYMERPEALALRLFWHRADKSGWMPHHFNNRILPDELYAHRSWGGLIVEA